MKGGEKMEQENIQPTETPLQEGWESAAKGYGVAGTSLDLSNPPQGGSGVPTNPPITPEMPAVQPQINLVPTSDAGSGTGQSGDAASGE